MTFFGKSRVTEEKMHHLHESPNSMTVPLIILAFLAIIGGYIGIPHALGGGAHFEVFLEPVFEEAHNIISHGEAHHALSTEYLLMIISIAVALIGIFVAYQFYLKKPETPKKLAEKFSGIYNLVYNKYYVDEIYDAVIVNPFVGLSNAFWKFIDVVIIDGFVNGVASTCKGVGMVVRRIQGGYVQGYILSFLIGVIFLIGYYLFR